MPFWFFFLTDLTGVKEGFPERNESLFVVWLSAASDFMAI